MIEPTGVADPRAIVSALKGHPSESMLTMVVVDAMRFIAIARALGKQLEAQVEAADTILINKIDVADQENLSEVARSLNGIPPSIKVIKISALNGSGIQDVIELIEQRNNIERKTQTKA